jgi:putative nucleotidyltransferase with HDIG domain
MSLLERLEADMRSRRSGWWERLGEVIPELQALACTPQPPEFHAEGDVAIHTRLAIETCPADCDPDLLWVALLHDIGKPATTQQHDDGRITAHGHAKRGADLAEVILARLAMPDERRRRIIWAIRHHIFHHSWQLTSPEELTNKQRAYLTSPDFPLLLEFLRVDSIASHGQTDVSQAYEFYRQIRQALTTP